MNEWKNIRKRLIVFGKALQGVSPYRVLIEANTKNVLLVTVTLPEGKLW